MDIPSIKRTVVSHYIRAMSLGAFLLRVLLCLGLVVNGSAQARLVSHPMLASHEAHAATPPCHEADVMASVAQAHEQRAETVSKKPDCCKSATCGCACSHGAVATMPALHLQARKVRHAAVVGLAVLTYDSPALPRVIRPPIV